MKIFFDFRFLSKQNKNKGFWILVYFGWLLGEDKCLSPIKQRIEHLPKLTREEGRNKP
jgi:hypothetical protein